MSGNLAFYDAFAEEYRDFYDRPRAEQAVAGWQAVLEEAGLWPRSISRVLDMGCGPGDHLTAWAARAGEVDGLDGSPAMLEVARASLVANGTMVGQLYCADVTAPVTLAPLRDRYSLVAAHFNFLNLFKSDQLAPVLESIQSVLTPGGFFIGDMLFDGHRSGWRDALIVEDRHIGREWRSLDVRVDASNRAVRRDWLSAGEHYAETLYIYGRDELIAIARSQGLALAFTAPLSHAVLRTRDGHAPPLESNLLVLRASA
ncbi:class I SAM-dependent methyltransferase [Sphingomonas sp. RT2P30]|uniref:class I SAM-dependent DNA methyltransferase n=1 Tax=Parasphingomonas halimpatiens TaxID=3096162 RepID=UPI002FCC88FE